MSRNFLSANNEFHKGDSLMSNNGQWKAVFQEDGNFVIYGWKPTWASDTCGSDGIRLSMQNDCNLVIYNKANQPKWSSDSYRPTKDNNYRLKLTDDGKLVISKDADELWSSASSTGKKL